MSEKCFVIPTGELVNAGLIPENCDAQAIYTPLQKFGGINTVFNLAKLYGEYRPRYGDEGVESDPAFQQIIMYSVAILGNKVLVYQRDKSGKYGDQRLTGRVSIGIGGHMTQTDTDLEQSMWRKIDNETEIRSGGKLIAFKPELIKVEHRGLIKDCRDDVGRVHLGIASIITPLVENIQIGLKTGQDTANFSYMTLADYTKMATSGNLIPEGWTQMLMQHEIMPRLSQQ